MKPKRYLKSFYYKDISVYIKQYGSGKIPRNGPTEMFCGLTLEDRMLSPHRWVYYHYPTDFVCSQYMFNLINLGIIHYLPDYHLLWCTKSKPFLDVTSCPTDHGSFSYEPYQIIKSTNSFIGKFRQHFETFGGRILPADKRDKFEVFPYEEVNEKQLKDYAGFYFHEYLPKLNIAENISRDLIRKLKKNKHYCKFAEFLNE